MNHSNYQRLSPSQQNLVRQMQEINFGRIEHLHVQNGQPIFTPMPKIVREVKFGGENGTRPEATCNDFMLKAQVVDLFKYVGGITNGVIELLEIKHGLPFRMLVVGK